MRIEQLTYFCQIVESNGFTPAANMLHIAQPALSQQLKALEVELGFKLLYRDTHGIKLTPAGKQYYYEVKSILGSLKTAQTHALDIQRGVKGVLSIGIASSSQNTLLDLLANFRLLYPATLV